MREFAHRLFAQRGGFHHRAALVGSIAPAPDQAVALHAVQYPGETGAQNEGLPRHPPGLNHAMFAQHAQHPPLLVAQAVFAQAWPGVRHHRLTCLQQQARQVTVDEGCCHEAGLRGIRATTVGDKPRIQNII